ncbi:MAG: YqaE/Pmp3 family membrane protein [Flavobacteriales bacterium]|nr:YqaE/Pmp3 family membrane protein [Flavobacteriales bacterium]
MSTFFHSSPISVDRNDNTSDDQNTTDNTLLLVIIAFFIPFLAVGLYDGITGRFWLSLILTFLFWLPGFIYALIVILE